MATDHQIKGEKYVECDVCGFTWRESETTVERDGSRVCQYCLDEV